MALAVAKTECAEYLGKFDHCGLRRLFSNATHCFEMIEYSLKTHAGLFNTFNVNTEELSKCYREMLHRLTKMPDRLQKIMTEYAMPYNNYVLAGVLCEFASDEDDTTKRTIFTFTPVLPIAVIPVVQGTRADVENIVMLHRILLSNECCKLFIETGLFNSLCIYQYYAPIINQLLNSKHARKIIADANGETYADDMRARMRSEVLIEIRGEIEKIAAARAVAEHSVADNVAECIGMQ